MALLRSAALDEGLDGAVSWQLSPFLALPRTAYLSRKGWQNTGLHLSVVFFLGVFVEVVIDE